MSGTGGEPRQVPLVDIARRVQPIVTLGRPESAAVTGVVFRHGDVVDGSLYCCLPGAHVDGHGFAAEARAAGAVALLCERSLGDLAGGAVQLVVAPGDARAAMARAACAFYADPALSLRTVGVTGTNGKTTTTYLLRSIFEQHGWPTGVVGTLDGPRTTPESPELQGFLAGFRDRGDVAAVVEVTSHALVQRRVDGICFDVAIFTNLSQDHLDFHGTMEAYFAAKATLFEAGRARRAVLNLDDAYARRIAERTALETVGYSLADASDLVTSPSRSTFSYRGRPVTLHLGGRFNVANALAAAAAATLLGVPDDAIVAGLESAVGVPGRFETVETVDGVVVVVDYAHTPAALEAVLRAARGAAARSDDRVAADHRRPHPDAGRRAGEGRLIVVFGAGGERDRGKRPAMGAVAGRLADVVVLTSDNPRSEDPSTIAAQVHAGVTGTATCRVELDRRAAIAWALDAARRGDVVVVAGKGHEATQQFAESVVRFDDRDIVREELERQGRVLPTSARSVSSGGAA